MYINNEDFEKWMDKLSKKLNDIGQDLKSLINTKEVFAEDEKLLDNCNSQNSVFNPFCGNISVILDHSGIMSFDCRRKFF